MSSVVFIVMVPTLMLLGFAIYGWYQNRIANFTRSCHYKLLEELVRCDTSIILTPNPVGIHENPVQLSQYVSLWTTSNSNSNFNSSFPVAADILVVCRDARTAQLYSYTKGEGIGMEQKKMALSMLDVKCIIYRVVEVESNWWKRLSSFWHFLEPTNNLYTGIILFYSTQTRMKYPMFLY